MGREDGAGDRRAIAKVRKGIWAQQERRETGEEEMKRW